MKDYKKTPTTIITVFFLCIACSVFSVLCLYETNIAFIAQNAAWFSVGAGAIFLTVALVCIRWILAEKSVWVKGIFTALTFILFCLILCFILQKTGFFNVIQNEESLRAYLEKAGVWMPVIYIILQFLQVVILPIPGIVSTAVGVALFGAFYTMIYSLIGIIAGSLVAFLIGRKLGNKAVSWLVGEATLQKWQKKLKGKDNFVLTLAFLLPLFPDDILCFIAGLSSMSTRYFIVMICIARLLAVSATCYSFDFIPFNTWWGLLIWGVIIVSIVVLFTVIYKNLHTIQSWFSKRFKKHKKEK